MLRPANSIFCCGVAKNREGVSPTSVFFTVQPSYEKSGLRVFNDRLILLGKNQQNSRHNSVQPPPNKAAVHRARRSIYPGYKLRGVGQHYRLDHHEPVHQPVDTGQQKFPARTWSCF